MTTNSAKATTRARTKGNGNVARGTLVGRRRKDVMHKTGRWQFLTMMHVDPRLVDDLTFNMLSNELGGWN